MILPRVQESPSLGKMCIRDRRTIEDVDRAVLTCAEAKALAVGDSKLKDAMVLQNETMRLSLERDAYLSLQDRMAEDLASYYPEEFQHLKETKKHLEADYRTIQHSNCLLYTSVLAQSRQD